MSLSKLKVDHSHTPGAGISWMMRPKYAFPKNAWIDAPGTAGPVIQAPQEPGAAAALVNQPGKIWFRVRGLRAPEMIFWTAATCGGVRQLGPSVPAAQAMLAGLNVQRRGSSTTPSL